ncbi:hypothetical protein CDL15_Pgr028124 [Punica granatum]|uniref:Uncharacterized protein n=1 Tax=Punica granatum TaxID=22663 RepID=A0A218WWJ4_PUNGR|nr:hypothetical protein CDL15_Pgr028124 [Punica granatum]
MGMHMHACNERKGAQVCASMHGHRQEQGRARVCKGGCTDGLLSTRSTSVRASGTSRALWSAGVGVSKHLEHTAERLDVRLSAWTRGPNATDHGTDLKC